MLNKNNKNCEFYSKKNDMLIQKRRRNVFISGEALYCDIENVSVSERQVKCMKNYENKDGRERYIISHEVKP